MRRLTVVQLLPALHSGGVERSTLEIASALVAAGHRAIVVSAGGRLVEPLLASGAEHLTLDIGRKSLLTLRHVLTLRNLFNEVGADIVHARSRVPAWLAWLALHITVLIGFRNRISVFVSWIYGYVFFRRGSRLITRSYDKTGRAVPVPAPLPLNSASGSPKK